MIATGAFLYLVGAFVLSVFGLSRIENKLGLYNRADYVGGTLTLIGVALVAFGLLSWLWKNAP